MLMISNKKLNIITGWSVFTTSLIIFLITASRTINFWDSGEIISCSPLLQVGHSPGAPFYMLLARLFSIFAIDIQNTAFTINLLSVFSSALTILFLYHSIQKISLKIFNSNLDKNKIIIIRGASIIGALSFAFSTSFWASSISANIYSLETLITAICFWITLKFSETNDKNEKLRWVILCSLLFGILIGIDLNSIFIIPALTFSFYFYTYKFKLKNFIIVVLYSITLLITIRLFLFLIPIIASKFELLFVNRFNLKYNSGLLFFVITFIILIVSGIYISGIKNKLRLNLLITCFAVFMSAHSIYSIIIIRSISNTPIDQNNPETIFNFLSYISQKQYGGEPLIYGQQYNSKLYKDKPYIEGDAIYDTLKNKYSIISHKPKSNYKDSDKVFLPRMWSNSPNHVAAYQEWTGYKENKIPPFSTNINFMLKYQFSHLYFRYFMWNFTGRQNDIQSHGGPMNGNWISGIKFIDNIRLGNIDNLPTNLSENKASNTYYFIPLILGILGIILQFNHDKKSFLILSTLFICTGLLISFYLNQHPYQAREKDYLYIGSFYTFSIWIGLGVIWIYEKTKKTFNKKYFLYIILLVCFLSVPIQFIAKNSKCNNYKNNDFAYNFAYNILNSCEKNAILFTWGDNETFPLWYLQEVENIRTDIRIVNLSFLNADWYIDQIIKKQKNSDGIKINIDRSKYISGQRELLLIKETTSAFAEDIYFENVKEINEDYSFILNKFINMLESNNFDKARPEEFKNFKNFYSKIQPYLTNPSFKDFSTIITNLSDNKYRLEFNLSQNQADEINKYLNNFINKQQQYPIPLNSVLNFVFSEDKETKIETKLYNYPIDYFPTRKLMLRINKNQIIDNFKLKKENITTRMEWDLNQESLTKSDLLILEIIMANMWEKPIYFSSTMNNKYYLGLEKYLYLEGMTYRLIPKNNNLSNSEFVNVNSSVMFKNLIENFKWGKLSYNKDTYYDENIRTHLTNLRIHYSYLASSLYFEGKIKESEIILDKCIELLPNSILSYNYYCIEIVRGYYRINKKDKAEEVAKVLAKNALKELEFYSNFDYMQQPVLETHKQRALKSIDELYNLANYYIHRDFIPEISKTYKSALNLYNKSNL